MTEDSQSEPSYHSLLAHQGQQPVGELVKCFFMDSLLDLQENLAKADKASAEAAAKADKAAADAQAKRSLAWGRCVRMIHD